MGKLSAMVRGFQSCCEQVRVEARLWSTDALALCDHELDESARFDAIDTSNLADNVELLNLLLMAGPRLKSQPAARCCMLNSCTKARHASETEPGVEEKMSYAASCMLGRATGP